MTLFHRLSPADQSNQLGRQLAALEAVRWSDISVLELDRKALFLSRVFAVSLAVFLVAF